MRLLLIFCILLLHQIACQTDNNGKYNQDNLNKKPLLTIHLIPHSHDDVGWLSTFEEYYQGTQQSYQGISVKQIINSVIDELQKDPKRKFIQVEVAFLHHWWIDSPEPRRELMRQLVRNKQLEFINGGWSMHDEATAYYEDIIDQMTIGHQWLLETFGEIPTIGWQIDPFGHQASTAALFNQMGFNGWWFSRMDYQDKLKRLSDSSLEMIWNPFQSSGNDNSIFTALNYHHYNPPPGFDFDIRGYDQKIQDIPEQYNYNVKQKSDQFVNYFKNMALHFRGKNLLHTMGEDFNYQNAQQYYDSVDKLIKYINGNQNIYQVLVQYSTPSIYLEELQKENITFPTKFDDFFPYADNEHSYWTGYFTSRVALKGNVRDSGRYLQHIRNIFSVAKITNSSEYLKQSYQLFKSHLDSFEQNMGILQHHDAVSGTAKQRVTNDYTFRLQNSTDRINEVLHPMMEESTFAEIGEKVAYYQYKWNLTANEWDKTYRNLNSGKAVLLRVHNPTVAREITVRIKVPRVALSIIDALNNQVLGEIFCMNQQDINDCDLYFKAKFQAYDSSYFKLVPNTNQGASLVEIIEPQKLQNLDNVPIINVSDTVTLQINNKSPQFELNSCGGAQNFRIKALCSGHLFDIQYNYYQAFQGYGQQSGAYIFRPSQRDLNESYSYSTVQEWKIFQGKLLTIVLMEGSNIISQIKIHANSQMKDIIELYSFIKSIPMQDNTGKEIVLLVRTNLSNNKTFYTDSNGLELQKRVINYRPTWNLTVFEPASGNYYPVNGLITLFDTQTQRRMSIVNDRSQGGTSLKEGQLELMIHRRLLNDDARGVGEALNEREDTNFQLGLQQMVRHFIVFANDGTTKTARFMQNYLDSSPIIFQASSESHTFQQFHPSQQHLSIPSPLLTNQDPFLRVYFRPLGEDYLLRLNNLKDEISSYYILPKGFKIIEELTLTGNQSKTNWLSNRYEWKQENKENKKSNYSKAKKMPYEPSQETVISVLPLELRAFRVRQVIMQ